MTVGGGRRDNGGWTNTISFLVNEMALVVGKGVCVCVCVCAVHVGVRVRDIQVKIIDPQFFQVLLEL